MNEDTLERLVEIQREMLRWIKFTSVPQLRQTLNTVLSTDLDKRIYEMTDGELTTRSIGTSLKTSKTTVSTKWAKWAQLGIVERLSTGQCRRLCSLGEVGIEVPGTSESNQPGQPGELGVE